MTLYLYQTLPLSSFTTSWGLNSAFFLFLLSGSRFSLKIRYYTLIFLAVIIVVDGFRSQNDTHFPHSIFTQLSLESYAIHSLARRGLFPLCVSCKCDRVFSVIDFYFYHDYLCYLHLCLLLLFRGLRGKGPFYDSVTSMRESNDL